MMISMFVRPRLVHRHAEPSPPVIQVPATAPIDTELSIADELRPTVEVMDVGTMAPHPDDSSVDPTEYARRAGLQAGEGATIVLRLEVLGTGDLGTILVETTGGSEAIDMAAIDYVRALAWAGGRVDGRPATIWIRWGVRLQA